MGFLEKLEKAGVVLYTDIRVSLPERVGPAVQTTPMIRRLVSK
jgi:hypothetical protein